MAYQTLYNEGTCEAFKASQPTCFDEGHGADSGRCPEAAAFQLVMDRNRDLDRTYAANDFDGVARNLYQNGAVFADSGVETDIGDLYKSWSSSDTIINRVSRKVLGRNSGDSSARALHELGSWVAGGDVARYTRWSYSGDPFGWQIQTDVDLRDSSKETAPSNYTDAISERYAMYSQLYEAGNFSGLVADLYTDDAILALTTGIFVEHDDLEKSLRQFYAEDPQRSFSVKVAVGNTANVVDDVGLVAGSQHYYARWEKYGETWKIAVQVQAATAVPQPTPGVSCAAHSACSGLAGNCCPTDAGVTLLCCGESSSSCSSHPGCASLGLDGNCCPDDEGLMLECCSSSSVFV